jgi:4-hydroxyproline epimerase
MPTQPIVTPFSVPERVGAPAFYCIDGHTCGNPVRVVAAGGPALEGKNMSEKRQHFLREFDWIRKGLMFEPRGHDMMSGSILYPPHDPANDVAILFIETSGCLPMCGHGTIGTVTIALQEGLIHPRTPGTLRLETPAGLITVHYKMAGEKVIAVKIINVPAYLDQVNLSVTCEGLGSIHVDVAYGGNFYAIVDPQENFGGIENHTAADLINWSPRLRKAINANYTFVHPNDPTIRNCSHILWTGKVMNPASHARNAVFYGDKAIDRSPCGTGTSARMAQWFTSGKLKQGDHFIHESIIGSTFTGTIEGITEIGGKPAIIPGIEGWAKVYGHNIITIHPEDDPYAHGFQVV